MLDKLDKYGYVLNVVVPVTILGEWNNLGMRITNGGATSTIFAADGRGGWRTGIVEKPISDIATNIGGMYALEHYSPLVVDRPGAVWAVESVRRGVREYDETLGYSFANAFIYLKVHEIACSSTTGANLTACEKPCLGAEKGGPNCDPTLTYIEFTNAPSDIPSTAPSMSSIPSATPTTSQPSILPSPFPTSAPTSTPTATPTSTPTKSPVVLTSSPAPTVSTTPTKSPVAPPDFPDIVHPEVGDAGSKGDPHCKYHNNKG